MKITQILLILIGCIGYSLYGSAACCGAGSFDPTQDRRVVPTRGSASVEDPDGTSKTQAGSVYYTAAEAKTGAEGLTEAGSLKSIAGVAEVVSDEGEASSGHPTPASTLASTSAREESSPH